MKSQEDTYTFHFQFSEETAGHEHSERDGEDENKWKSKGYWAGLHEPQDGKENYLDGREQVHSPCAYLYQTYTDIH